MSSTAAEFAADMDEITDDLQARMLEAGRKVGWRIVGIMKSSTKFKDETGNLRDSIGVRQTTKIARHRLGLHATPEDQAEDVTGKFVRWTSGDTRTKSVFRSVVYRRSDGGLGNSPATLIHVKAAMAYAYFVQYGIGASKTTVRKASGKGGRPRKGEAVKIYRILARPGTHFMDEGMTAAPGIFAEEFGAMATLASADWTIRVGGKRNVRRGKAGVDSASTTSTYRPNEDLLGAAA